MDLSARKDTIRRLALVRRDAIPAEERALRGAQAVERLLALPEVAAARSVVAFVSVRSEIPTDVLLEAILAEEGRTLMLPFVAEDGAMRVSAVRELDELRPGFRGIPEPRSRMPADPATADVIVVPGVAFDLRGGRLGYGGGFYDRFLAAAPGVPRVGVCFEAQVVEAVPALEHDQAVDVLVTEERTIRC